MFSERFLEFLNAVDLKIKPRHPPILVVQNFLVSVVIPCLNAELWIAEAIQSAIDQTYSNIEIIVVDDGSTDRSVEIIKSFGTRVKLLPGPTKGACAARNEGMRIAGGNYIQFLDADDFLHPEKIESQMKVIEDKHCLLILGRCYRTRASFNNISSQTTAPIINFEIDGREFFIRKRLGEIASWINPNAEKNLGFSLPHSWLVSRDLIDRVGPWDESLYMAQDIDYLDRLCLESPSVHFVGSSICYYRVHDFPSVSKGTSFNHAKSKLSVCKKAERIFSFDDSSRAKIAVARSYFAFLLAFYPTYPSLATDAFNAISSFKIKNHLEIRHKATRVAAMIIGLRATLLARKFLRLFQFKFSSIPDRD